MYIYYHFSLFIPLEVFSEKYLTKYFSKLLYIFTQPLFI